MTRWLGSLIRFGLWALLFGVAVAVTIFAAQANYLGCRAALELLRYEEMPAFRDPLLGPLIGPFFGSATQVQCLALLIVLVETLGFFLLAHLLFEEVWTYFQMGLEEQERGNAVRARVARRQISVRLVWIGCLLIGLIPIAIWDVNLFRYRAIAGSLGIDDPTQAPLMIADWPIQMEQHGHLWAWKLAALGGLGYLALTLVGCLASEFTRSRAVDHFLDTVEPVERLIRSWFGREEDALGAVRPPNTDELAENEFPEPSEAQLEVDPGAALPGNLSELTDEPGFFHSPHASDGNTREVTPKSSPALDPVELPNAAVGRPPEVTSSPERRPRSTPRIQPARPTESTQPELLDVIGGNGTRVSLTAARLDADRYHVDEATRQIWDRASWEALTAEPAANGNGKEPSV